TLLQCRAHACREAIVPALLNEVGQPHARMGGFEMSLAPSEDACVICEEKDMSIRYRPGRRLSLCCCLVAALVAGFGMNAQAYSKRFPPPPADKNVVISNGGLSITFNMAWGASVIAIVNKNVAHGLNIVDSNDVGRELQPCQFLMFKKVGGFKGV